MDRRWPKQWQGNKRWGLYTAHKLKKGQWGRIRHMRVRAGIGYRMPLARARSYPWDLIARASIGRTVGRYEHESPWGTRQYRRKRRFTLIGVLLSLWMVILPKTHGLVNRQ